MGGKSKSAPPPPQPDPYATARAQTGSNVSTSIANTVMGNANVVGPLGSTTYQQRGTYTLSEPVLDKDGNQKMTRRWVADPIKPEEMQYRVFKEGTPAREMGGEGSSYTVPATPGGFIDSRTGQAWSEGGRWVEEPEMLKRELPMWEQTNTLTPDQQRLLDEQEYLGVLLNSLAINQTKRLDETLSKPVGTDGLVRDGSAYLNKDGLIRGPNLDGVFSSIEEMKAAEKLQTRLAPSAPIRFGFDATSRGVEYANPQGRATGTIGANGQPVGMVPGADAYANVGGPARDLGGFGFETERARVENALRQRQQPELDRQRAALENQLVNQGFVRGTQAFTAQMDEQLRRENDAEMAAILAGGQEQTRMGQLAIGKFSNENAAQAQADEQARARGMFALGQQQQEFGQAMDRTRLANDAVGQNFQMDMAATEARNAAQRQEFEQAMARGGFYNAAQSQDFGEILSRGGFKNDALSGQTQRDLSVAGLEMNARMAEFQAQLEAMQAQQGLRQQQMQEQLALRNQPINEIAALMNGGQVTMPQFSQFRPSAMSETPVGDYVYRGYDIASQNYRAQEQANAQARAGLFGMGGQILGAGLGLLARSDIRVKTEVERIGRIENGLGVYRFRYKDGGPLRVGLMAQEVEQIRPDAVIDLGGLKIVDYAMAVQ